MCRAVNLCRGIVYSRGGRNNAESDWDEKGDHHVKSLQWHCDDGGVNKLRSFSPK